jgi:hypothetical protein
MSIALQCWLTIRSFAVVARGRLVDEAGEGVISTAIAVLIIALLGAAMWAVFKGTFDGMTEKVSESVNEIG